MILVDTSVWIDHLHQAEPELIRLLNDDEVGCHALVIEELALGAIKQRQTVLELLGSLRAMPVLSHRELLTLVDGQRLWGRCLSSVDVHLLGAVALSPGARLWTRDRRLAAACRDTRISAFTERHRPVTPHS